MPIFKLPVMTSIVILMVQKILELSVIMTPTKLNKIRKYNKQNDYTDFKLKCRFSGKEWVSELLTELVADDSKLKSILENNRANGWKYFIKKNGKEAQ